MDLDTVCDELYGLAPDVFTAVRDERARAAGERGLAERIRRLRRPTRAAWASNLLVRERPEEARALVRLGEALRRAHRELDGERLRELSVRQGQAVDALARQAGRLADAAGHPLAGSAQQEVRETLRAVLADADAGERWAEGRLDRPLAVAGFPAAAPEREPRAPERGSGRHPGGCDDTSRGRDARRDTALRRARRNADETRDELRRRDEEFTAAREEHRRCDELARQAERRLTELAGRWERARGENEQAREAARRAGERVRTAQKAVEQAGRSAEEAAMRVRRLSKQGVKQAGS